jgi:hypothetical protein
VDQRIGGGERGEKLSPSHAEAEARIGSGRTSAESSDLSSRGIRGVAINCAWCKKSYVPDQPAGTYHPDSDGMCPPCGVKFAADADPLNQRQVLPAVEDAPESDEREPWPYTKSFLTGLGLEPLPGAVWS